MEKKLSDYLHLYLGAECIIGDRNWKRQEIADEDRAPYTDPDFGMPIKSTISLHTLQHHSHKITLILRPLSDMTEEEKQEASLARGGGDGMANSIAEAHEFRYLLSKHFDLFGLIDANLALDKTKL